MVVYFFYLFFFTCIEIKKKILTKKNLFKNKNEKEKLIEIFNKRSKSSVNKIFFIFNFISNNQRFFHTDYERQTSLETRTRVPL